MPRTVFTRIPVGMKAYNYLLMFKRDHGYPIKNSHCGLVPDCNENKGPQGFFGLQDTGCGKYTNYYFSGSNLDKCVDECSKKACAVDLHLRYGCNQMFKCAQACKMRDCGLTVTECRQKCQRNGQAGCFPLVKGWRYHLCAACNRAGCTTWPFVQECEVGCDVYGTGE